MVGWKKRLASIAPVAPFGYPYMREKRKAPDPQPKLVAAHREALATTLVEHDGPAVLAGKSMGSRIGCHVALEDPNVAALVCLGYPLSSPGKRSALRDEVLLALKVPILFVQGTRDSLCPLDLLDGVRKRMQAPNELHVVDGGDHSLVVSATKLKAAGETQADSDTRVLAAIKQFLDKSLR